MHYRHLLYLLVFVAVPAFGDTKVMLPDSQRFADGRKDFMVETTIPGDFKSLDAVVLALLSLSPQAANKKVSAPFFPGKDGIPADENTRPLYQSFRGLRKKGGTVTLRFSGEAMVYLNSAISMQDFIKGALEGTIKLHATDCKKVEYEIDGEVVEEWDA